MKKRYNLTVSLRVDRAVSGHRPSHMVSKRLSSSQKPSIQRTQAEMKLQFYRGGCVCGNRLPPHEQTRMRSSLLPCHPSTRNWDNECWETLEQCNFTCDQLFKRVMSAFMQLCVCMCVPGWCLLNICVTMQNFGDKWAAVLVQPNGRGTWETPFCVKVRNR